MIEDMHDYGVYADAMDIVFNEELEDSNAEEDEHTNANNSHKCRHLTDTERQQIYEALLEKSVNGKLRKNNTNKVAELFIVRRSAVWRIWKRAKQCQANGIPVDISSRKPKNCGRKKVQVDLSQVPTIPLHRRWTIRSLAEALGLNKSTVHRLFKQGLLRRHSNTIKPYLTEANKK